MIRKDDNDPLGPIGSRFEARLDSAASKPPPSASPCTSDTVMIGRSSAIELAWTSATQARA